MSVLVKGMDGSKFGEQFEVKIDANGNLFLYRVGSEDDIFYISELPKHGRLIDADALESNYTIGGHHNDAIPQP